MTAVHTYFYIVVYTQREFRTSKLYRTSCNVPLFLYFKETWIF